MTRFSFATNEFGYINYIEIPGPANGNLFGTTIAGGTNARGAVYEVSPSGGGWMESMIYTFKGEGKLSGALPLGGLTMDSAGNLYGTTEQGGAYSLGSVYELTYTGSGWTETILHSFDGSDGSLPQGGVIFDSAGNLYGSTSIGGQNWGGIVFELTPSNGTWQFTTLYPLAYYGRLGGPTGNLTMDAAGNLYGATLYDG